MLKLTVGKNDKIEIDGGITVTVLSIGKRVQLGFDAPRAVGIGTVFSDADLQDKNLRKAQAMTPEKQREIALNQFKKRGFKR